MLGAISPYVSSPQSLSPNNRILNQIKWDDLETDENDEDDNDGVLADRDDGDDEDREAVGDGDGFDLDDAPAQ